MVSSGDPLWYLHYLVRGLQVIGSFPYSWGRSSQPATATTPKFSVILSLWSIVTRLIILIQTVKFHFLLQYQYDSNSVDDILNKLASFITTDMFHLGSMLSIGISPFLARLLFSLDNLFCSDQQQLTTMTTCRPTPITRKIFKFIDHQTLLFFCTHNLLCIGAIVSMWKEFTDVSILEKQMSTISTIILMSDSFMVLFTYKEILNILGECIKKNTSWAVDGRPGDDKPLMDHTTTVMKRLLHLECQITQVEEVLGRVPRCFIITISCLVITVCFMLITCCFNIIKNGFLFTLLLTNFNSITLIYFICSSSQMFINQVEDAVRCLRLCSARTEDVIIKGQVYRLIQYLGAIGKVNFHGWFSLTHGTMVSLGSLVVTYLVVMLQVA